MNKQIIAFIIAVAALIIIGGSIFTVNETQQCVVVKFGEIIRVIKEPGLHFKMPLIQDVEYFEKRLLEYDSDPKEIITKDKKTLVVDNYARWKIIDPTKLYETVRNENGAQARLDDIIYSDLRNELGKYNLNEIVSSKREEILQAVARLSDGKSRGYGIEVVDVRIKRADLPTENEASVYERMRTERRRQANLYRSEGKEEALKIRAETDREKTILLADAYQIAEKIRGEGDAEALKIYADAYNRNPDFYQFSRTLEAYVKALKGKTTIVMPPNSDFLKYLKGIK